MSHTFSWGEFKLAPRIAEKIKSGEQANVIIDIQGTALPIQGAQMRIGMQRGCDKEQARLAIACRLTGPVTTNTSAQLAELETLLSGNQVDCLGLQSPLPDQYVGIIDKYVKAGVPVFTLNNDVPNSKRFAFYALNEQQSGEINGKTTAAIVKAKGLTLDTVALGSGQPAGPWAQARMTGFVAGFKSAFPAAKFFNDPKSGIPTGDNFTTQEVLNSVGPFLLAHNDVNLFFHTDQGVEGVGDIIKSKNLTGKVWTSGFNVSGPILDSIDAGRTLVTIDQGFDNQAEAPVSACVDYLTTGKVPSEPLQYLQPIVITKDGGSGLMTTAEARKRLADATTR
ncbi:sugar ABC transporter substrate-binding protein [Sphaerisporangium sp. NBC_01403]|uniref:sugar ABC transporter substrate-binding protein n=1 Tax=Sphaerisporangium sp. NBC_01403 TaxID=2903599 RepID=UPI0032457C94